MSRWGKNIVVPLDTLIKEKESPNLPTVARSVGTVGKWGKLGFTSTRTYAMSALPSVVAAAAAAVAADSPVQQSPASAGADDELSPTIPEPAKPKKFFKSRNTAPPEVIAQIIQQLPRMSTSPSRETNICEALSTPVHGPEPNKATNKSPEKKKKAHLKIPTSLKTKKHKSKALNVESKTADDIPSTDDAAAPLVKPKSKKKKEEKKLKPEAAPSRVLSRARRAVNYCEDDEDDRTSTPIRDIIIATNKSQDKLDASENTAEPVLPPPQPPIPASNSSAAQKTPEHPPIVLRISKGTSRLVSTDSEDPQTNNNTAANSPQDAHDNTVFINAPSNVDVAPSSVSNGSGTKVKSRSTSMEEATQKITVKASKPPLSEPPVLPPPTLNYDEAPEINYSIVKISPDKPPKERLKLIIKTDVIRNALAAAAAKAAANAEKAAAASGSGTESGDRSEKEKKQKVKKHKHVKQSSTATTTATPTVIEQQSQQYQSEVIPINEFKVPSPHISLSENQLQQQQHNQQIQQQLNARTVISPPAASERDFDSQSSVLGSISSKGNCTPQPLAQALQEESCVLRSRGSSVITSDLETSQHSSLVAPPSDIELRLESMMMDGDVSQTRPLSVLEEQPLQKEDLIAVLRGEEPPVTPSDTPLIPNKLSTKINGIIDNDNQFDMSSTKDSADVISAELDKLETTTTKRRGTRRRGRGAANTVKDEEVIELKSSMPDMPPKAQNKQPQPKAQNATTVIRSTRNRKPLATATAIETAEQEPTPAKRTTRRGVKKIEDIVSIMPMDVDAAPIKSGDNLDSNPQKLNERHSSPNKSEEENTTPVSQLQTTPPAVATRRGTRSTRIVSSNTSLNANNNSNINKIAANLSAKAGAAEEAAKAAAITTTATTTTVFSDTHSNINISTTSVPAPSIETATSTASDVISPTTKATASVTRSYGRKRKNQQVTQVLQPSAEELEEHQQHQHPPPPKVPNIEDTEVSAEESLAGRTLDDAITQKNQQPYEDDNMDNNSVSASPPRRDYKIKDKFKRTLTLDSQVNCNANDAAFASEDVRMAANSSNASQCGATVEPEDEQRGGSVKLVISKKKGSIFKSRALAPASEQAEQNVVSKWQLYKHSWNERAEANGNARDDGNANELNDNHNQKPQTADDVYDDFGGGNDEDVAESSNPTFGKLTRVIKPNPQALGTGSNNAPNNASSAGSSSSSSSISGSGGACNSAGGSGSIGGIYNADFEPDTITSVKVDRKTKDYYTVVRNVKSAHQIQEIGEYQEMDDDVEYILDALQPHNPTPTRCLSALQLATKCTNSAFRMHVRAHGIVSKFFKALSDANNDLSLGLCTSAIMFILSQEGLNMDLDHDSLELMMNLLESEGTAAPSDRANYDRNRQKVRELCEDIKAQGKATHLNVDALTVGTLAMETLLSLTSKRAGEWFKEELRKLGGLEHIIKTISELCRPIFESSSKAPNQAINWTQSMLDNLQTVERCMRVLENVTQMNEENQRYMLTYSQGSAVDTLCTMYRICNSELKYCRANETSSSNELSGVVMMRELLLIPVMKVLINLTHPFNPMKPLGAELFGQRVDIIDISFQLLFLAPNYIPESNVFDLSILVLLLLINLSMYTPKNRAVIMAASAPSEYILQNCSPNKNMSAVQALMEYFYKCEEMARLVEKNTDAFLDNQEKNKKKQEEVDETVNNLLQKAGHHMEHTLKGSYAGMLMGHLITDNEEYEMVLRGLLRGNGFKEIVSVLEKYHTFMNLTASTESSVVAHIRSTKKLIDYFKKRDLVYEMNKNDNAKLNESKNSNDVENDDDDDDDDDDNTLPLNLETHHHRSSDNSSSTYGAMSSGSGGSSSSSNNNIQRVYKTYNQR